MDQLVALPGLLGVCLLVAVAVAAVRRLRLGRMDEQQRTAAVAAAAMRDLRRDADRRQRRKAQAAELAGTTWVGPGTNESAALTWGPGLL
jgi:hypothetical protein